MSITREEAYKLLTEYNKEEFHIQHAETVESVMKYFAKLLGYGDEEDFWGTVGLLHDLDYEMYPEKHCVKEIEIMKNHGVDDRTVRAAACHGYGLTGVEYEPEHTMEKVLFTIDELSGLIGAAILMRPSKSAMDLELKSLKKKFKTPSFASGCSRETISKGAEMLGWDMDYLLEHAILAMREYETRNK